MKFDIIQHIKELFVHHDCIIIPGFGGFILNYRPAEISDHQNFFRPPGKDISFNKSLIHNDGLLINKISQAEKDRKSTRLNSSHYS